MNILNENTFTNSFNSDIYNSQILKQRPVRTQIISQKFKAGMFKEDKENYKTVEDEYKDQVCQMHPPKVIGVKQSSNIESSNKKDNQGSDFKKRIISDLAMKIQSS